MADYTPCVVVTGASVGIGREFCRLIAREKRSLVLIARNHDQLVAVAHEVTALGGQTHILALDVAKPGATSDIVSFLDNNKLYCDILIANAGFGLSGAAIELGVEPQLSLLDVNIRALTDQTLTFLPGMVARGRGGVLLVASTASFIPGPFMACYYASKAFVRSFGEALHQETQGSGVNVSTLCPGPVKTEFFQRANMEGMRLFKLMPHMDAASVAKAGWDGFLAGKRIILPGFFTWLSGWSSPFVPHAVLLPILARLQKKRQKVRT